MFNDSSARFWIGREHRTYAFENAVVHQFPAYYVVHTCHLMIPRRLSRFKLFQPGRYWKVITKKEYYLIAEQLDFCSLYHWVRQSLEANRHRASERLSTRVLQSTVTEQNARSRAIRIFPICILARPQPVPSFSTSTPLSCSVVCSVV